MRDGRERSWVEKRVVVEDRGMEEGEVDLERG